MLLLGRSPLYFLLTVFLMTAFLFMPIGAAHAQSDDKDEAREQKLRIEAIEALDTLSNLRATRQELANTIKQMRSELKRASEATLKKEMEDKINAETQKLEQIDKQVSALASGVADDEINGDDTHKFDLQAELVSLMQPFIKMMKDATENARQIEKLNRMLVKAENQQRLAQRAIERLNLLTSVESQQNDNDKDATSKQLAELLKLWRKRAQEARDLEETAKQQLTVRVDEQSKSAGGLGTYATEFLRNRGLNLLLAITAFGSVFVIMGFIARIATWMLRRQGIPRTFATRLVGLLFKVATAIAAFLAMLSVFNIMNDWLLLGVASLFAVAMAWIGLKMLPSISEQITLLLNLGAVQEDERLMFAGVPWKVRRLDFYTDLENPALDGGTFTLPVRELLGLHSRPAAIGEPWFPTGKGDWVQLKDGVVGRVLSQTPELVQLAEPGGSVLTFKTSDFMTEAPRNLSTGYRVRTEFGLDYRHQGIATVEIPDKLGEYVERGLKDMIGPGGVTSVDVDLLSAGDSAIVFEVEACINGGYADRFEDVEREIPRLLVDACNREGWVIPFPQMVLHRADQD